MAYRIIRALIAIGRKSKEELLTMCDVYYGSGRLTDDEYMELVNLISPKEEGGADEESEGIQ